MISLKNVSFFYNEKKEILKNITIDIDSGQFIAIVGPNGSGKSTFAKLLNGLLLPSKGDVIVDGLNTKDSKNLWEIRKKVGIVFQNPENGIVGNTVEEDIAFGPENLGVPPEIIRKRVESALDAIKIKELAKRPPHMLSGGQKQKVALAGALALGSKYLVLDEATSMLDPKSQKEILLLLKELHKKYKLTIILITHYMEEAVLADRIILLKNGRIIADGAPKKIFLEKALLKKMNLKPPLITKLGENLKKRGIPLNTPILTEEELVDTLCSYKQKM